ncbi:MAG: hypothetical protein U9Q91_00215 [Candidatus Marinimicrobia bacterium]|nr:hypothetical protein [Candidatus Neomarinimicrobiota bacterium]
MAANYECIKVEITETETIQAQVIEETIQAQVIEETIQAQVIEETIQAQVIEETIQAQVIEETIHVTIDGWSCPPSCEGDGGGKIEVEFDHNDIISGNIVIGGVPSEVNIHSTFIDITESFDGETGFTIGTQAAQAWLMRIDENAPDVVTQFMVANNLEVDGTLSIRLFSTFTTQPSQGKGRATIYFH